MPSTFELLATRAAQSSGLSLIAESNVTPPIVLYDARAEGTSLLDLLGIKTHVIARTADGRILIEYGTPVRPNYVLAAVLLVGVFMLVTVAGGAAVKGLKAL